LEQAARQGDERLLDACPNGGTRSRRFAGSYVAAHGAAMMPNRIVAPNRRHHRLRTEALAESKWCAITAAPAARIPLLPLATAALPRSVTPSRRRIRLEQRRREMYRGSLFPRHRQRAKRNCRTRCARGYQIDGYMLADEGRSREIIVLARDPRMGRRAPVGVLAVLAYLDATDIFNKSTSLSCVNGWLDCKRPANLASRRQGNSSSHK